MGIESLFALYWAFCVLFVLGAAVAASFLSPYVIPGACAPGMRLQSLSKSWGFSPNYFEDYILGVSDAEEAEIEEAMASSWRVLKPKTMGMAVTAPSLVDNLATAVAVAEATKTDLDNITSVATHELEKGFALPSIKVLDDKGTVIEPALAVTSTINPVDVAHDKKSVKSGKVARGSKREVRKRRTAARRAKKV